MEDLREQLRAIERDLDNKTYQPGPWAAFLREARRRSPQERAALAEDVSRVNNKLHRRKYRFTLPFPLALALELALTGWAVDLLRKGLPRKSPLRVGAAANILSFTLQPIVKTTVGQAMSVKYSYAYMQGAEPHFKMQYGSYLAAPRWKRILVQASGMLGTPLALWLVARLSMLTMPKTGKFCKILFWFFASWQVILFLLGLSGVKRLGKLELVRATSGGAAAGEIRDAFVE